MVESSLDAVKRFALGRFPYIVVGLLRLQEVRVGGGGAVLAFSYPSVLSPTSLHVLSDLNLNYLRLLNTVPNRLAVVGYKKNVYNMYIFNILDISLLLF